MKKTVIFALALVALRWAAAMVLMLVISWTGWQLFLHSYIGLPPITLLQLIGFYCCVIIAGMLIGIITEVIRNR